MTLDRKNYLRNIVPVEVSLCGTPMVPGATIALIKSMDGKQAGDRLTKSVTFLSKDEMKKQVYAYVLIPDDADREGDVVTKEEVEKACDNFGMILSDKKQKGTGAGDSHEVFEDVAKIAQSCIDVEGTLGKALGFAKAVAGAWLVKFQIVSDEVWKCILDGTYTGVSMGAFAEREPIPAGKAFSKAVDSILKKLGLKKSTDYNATYSLQEFYDEFPDMMDALYSSLWSIIYDENLDWASKGIQIETSINQFRDSVLLIFSSAEKSLKANNAGGLPSAPEGEQEMKPEDVQKMLDAALAPILKSIGDLKTELTTQLGEVKKSAEVKLEETEFGKQVTTNIDKLTDAMQGIAKHVKGSNALEPSADDPIVVAKAKAEKEAIAKDAEGKERVSGTSFDFHS